MGWQGSIVTISFVAATIIPGLITLSDPSYSTHLLGHLIRFRIYSRNQNILRGESSQRHVLLLIVHLGAEMLTLVSSIVPKQWHGTLLIIAVVLFCIVFNTTLAKKLPLIEVFILVLHIVGLFAIVIPLWVMAPRNSAKVAFTQFNNGGNWPTMGTAYMIGLLTALSSMMGFDCSVHMCKSLSPGILVKKISACH